MIVKEQSTSKLDKYWRAFVYLSQLLIYSCQPSWLIFSNQHIIEIVILDPHHC